MDWYAVDWVTAEGLLICWGFLIMLNLDVYIESLIKSYVAIKNDKMNETKSITIKIPISDPRQLIKSHLHLKSYFPRPASRQQSTSPQYYQRTYHSKAYNPNCIQYSLHSEYWKPCSWAAWVNIYCCCPSSKLWDSSIECILRLQLQLDSVDFRL